MGTQLTARHPRDRRQLAKRERELAKLASRQHGVLSRQQLLASGLGPRSITRRIEAGRLHPVHRGVYALGHNRLDQRGQWMAAVLAGGDGTVLSHRSAAALWGLMRAATPIEITAPRGRRRPSIVVHESGLSPAERTARARIPVTTVARTLFDLAEVVDERRHERAWEEADRLGLLKMQAVEDVCARGHGRHALPLIRRLIESARLPETVCSPLEERFLEFCREREFPQPQTNVLVLGKEVDAYWPGARLVVESDGWSVHGHRAAFERDRARDAAMQVQGYRVLRVTDRRLTYEPNELAAELRALLTLPRGRAGD